MQRLHQVRWNEVRKADLRFNTEEKEQTVVCMYTERLRGVVVVVI